MTLPGYADYLAKMGSAFEAHGLPLANPGEGTFSDETLQAATAGDWDPAARELTAWLETKLADILADHHSFVADPYVRRIEFPDGGSIAVGIINAQAADWYGTDTTIISFDFLKERGLGLFDGCKTFLDLGGHQLVWAAYYAMTSPDARVVTFEPSILNVAIGLFNCLINGVVEQVEVVPFAVKSSIAADDGDEGNKMLVDFLTVPLLAKTLPETISGAFDFVKVDIEGYEFEMLEDPEFRRLMHELKCGHLELHLGHLVHRGVDVPAWVERLRAADIDGKEYYSGTNMYQFLETCDPKGYHAFIVRS